MALLHSAKVAQRVAAVLDLFRGIPLAQVTTQCGICRSDLYKFRRRALAALHQALADQSRGLKRPHNRLPRDTEHRIASLCQRYPTRSAAQIQQRYGPKAPCPWRGACAKVPKGIVPRISTSPWSS